MTDCDLEDRCYRQPQGFAHYECEWEDDSCGWFWWLTTTTFVVQMVLENLGTRNTIVKREKLYSWRLEVGFGEWLDPETNADESRMRSRKERQLSGPSPRSLSLLHNLRLIPIGVERLKMWSLLCFYIVTRWQHFQGFWTLSLWMQSMTLH